VKDIIETKINLSDESIEKILISEVAKIVLNNPDIINEMVKNVLFTRPPKVNSYDKPRLTFFESAVEATLKPMITDIVGKELLKNKTSIKKALSKALKTELVDHGVLAERIIERLSTLSSNIGFYVKEE
jgi:hypothetical protein